MRPKKRSEKAWDSETIPGPVFSSGPIFKEIIDENQS